VSGALPLKVKNNLTKLQDKAKLREEARRRRVSYNTYHLWKEA